MEREGAGTLKYTLKTNDTLIYLLIACLTIYTPIRFFLIDFVASPFRFFSDLAVFAVLLLALPILWKRLFPLHVSEWFFLAFAVIGLISSFINQIPLFHALAGLRGYFLFFFLTMVLYRLPLDIAWLRRIVQLTMGMAIFLVLTSVLGLVLFGSYGPAAWVEALSLTNKGRLLGLLKNPNGYGAYLMMIILAMIAWYLHILPERGRVVSHRIVHAYVPGRTAEAFQFRAFGLVLALVLFALVYTFSRSSWLGTAFGTITLVLVSLRSWRKAWLPILITVLMVIPFFVPIAKYLPTFENAPFAPGDGGERSLADLRQERLEETFSEGTLALSQGSGRLFRLQLGATIIREHFWLGTGLATFGGSGAMNSPYNIHEEYNLPPDFPADNQYLRVWVETGTLGFIAFMGMLFSVVVSIIRIRRRTQDTFSRMLASLLLAWALGMGVLNLLANMLEVQQLSFLLWTWYGFLLALDRSEREHPGGEVRISN
jgi:O-antigen ligase